MEYVTRVTPTSNKLIDHTISDLPSEFFPGNDKDFETGVRTDHKALLFSYVAEFLPKSKSSMVFKEFKKYDSKKFADLIRLSIHYLKEPTIVEVIEIMKEAKALSTARE